MRSPWLIVAALLAIGHACTSAEPATQTPRPETERRLQQRLTEMDAYLEKKPLPAGRIFEEYAAPSVTSALVYWQTENPATSYVEYGVDAAYGQKTEATGLNEVSGRPCWTQSHRLRGLKPGTTYHFRMVSVGTDGQTSRSDDRAFTTGTYGNAIKVPDDLAGGPPYVLDKKGATYILTRDLEVDGAAVSIETGGLAFDLDGHTIIYNAKPITVEPFKWVEILKKVYGIKADTNGRGRDWTPIKILNGVIRQGGGNNKGREMGIGPNPLYCVGPPPGSEIANLDLSWSGDDVSGIYLHWGSATVHHCTFEDRGAVITNRHQGIAIVDGEGPDPKSFHHNLVRRQRQMGLMAAGTAERNEIYIDSYDTNSFAIGTAGSSDPAKLGAPVIVAHNRIFGLGNHPVGIGQYKLYAPGSKTHDNFVVVECTRENREYGWTGSACYRSTFGANNLDVFDNTFCGYASLRPRGKLGVTGQTRPIWVGLAFQDWIKAKREEMVGRFHGNLIVGRSRDEKAHAGAVCLVCWNECPNLTFSDNLVISSYANVLLADNYGDCRVHAKFVGNIFRREGERPDYRTVRQDYNGRGACATFLWNRYELGAAANSQETGNGGNLVYQHALDVQARDATGAPVGDAEVLIRDASGNEVFRGKTAAQETEAALVSHEGRLLAVREGIAAGHPGYLAPVKLAKGTVRVILSGRTVIDGKAEACGEYSITVTKDGKNAEVKVRMDKDQAVIASLPM